MNIKILCKKYTNLSDEDIEEIEKVSETIQTTAELVDADVFIDCLTSEEDKAVVVAQAKPLSGKSNYDKSVIGKFALEEDEPAAIKTLNTGTVSRGLKAITQEKKNVKQHTVPIRNKTGKIIGVLIIEQDPRNMDENESDILLKPIYSKIFEEIPETFEQINKNMGFIIDNIESPIIIFNSKGLAIYANDFAEKLYEKIGYEQDIIGVNFDEISLSNNKFKYFKDGDVGEENLISEIKIKNHYLKVKYNLIIEKEGLKGINMIVFDETEKKEKERELVLKSVVIKEIHHRVKNNLQTIVSLLRLQSRRVDEPYIRKAFNESISRISSISIIHELLAEEGIDEIYIKDILDSLRVNMLKYIENPDLTVNIDLVGSNFYIHSDKSTSIALIANELMQNSIEHGFKGRKQGNILISIEEIDEYMQMKIIDDGLGFNVEDKGKYNLGLNIVEQLVKDKLDGELLIHSDEFGTEVKVKIKKE